MRIQLAIALGITLVAAVSAQTKKELTEREAIKFAEEFVAKNGYTDLPPVEDRSKLSFETVELGPNVGALLKRRQNTLERKAYGVSNNGRLGESGWTIAFRSKYTCKECKNPLGRAVTMRKDGSEIRVEHKEFFLRNVKKRL